jgi:hypothetical protein
MMSLSHGLIEFLEESNPAKKPVSGSTRLFHDMRIYGDDADELIAEYSKRFEVDVSSFRIQEYFPDEGDSFFHNLFMRLMGKQNSRDFKEFPVSMLQEGIDNGKL